jgi:hypothetical protein
VLRLNLPFPVGGKVEEAAQSSFAITVADKDREEWFSLVENHEKAVRFPDFL